MDNSDQTAATRLSTRLAELTPERRLLLERLLGGKGSPPPPAGAAPEPLTPAAFAGAAPELTHGPPGPGREAKTLCRRFFDVVNGQLDATVFGDFSYFLNFGYAPDRSREYAAVTLPEHYFNKNSAKLVLEVIGDCDLTDRRVLDVGCGRGGTAYVIHEFFRARTVTGLDLSPKAVAFCRARHAYRGVSFSEGDAENLPFPDASFDVVTNIESSQSYPDIAAFYSGVFRVLSPGGHFLYTDVLPVAQMSEWLGLLRVTGFVVERDRDITGNVLLSCDELARNRMQAFTGENDQSLMRNFLGAPGSEVYEEMKARRWTYRIFKLRKRG